MEDYPGVSDKRGSFLTKTVGKRGQTGPNPLNKSIDLASLGPFKGRLTYGSPDVHNKSSSFL